MKWHYQISDINFVRRNVNHRQLRFLIPLFLALSQKRQVPGSVYIADYTYLQSFPLTWAVNLTNEPSIRTLSDATSLLTSVGHIPLGHGVPHYYVQCSETGWGRHLAPVHDVDVQEITRMLLSAVASGFIQNRSDRAYRVNCSRHWPSYGNIYCVLRN